MKRRGNHPRHRGVWVTTLKRKRAGRWLSWQCCCSSGRYEFRSLVPMERVEQRPCHHSTADTEAGRPQGLLARQLSQSVSSSFTQRTPQVRKPEVNLGLYTQQ